MGVQGLSRGTSIIPASTSLDQVPRFEFPKSRTMDLRVNLNWILLVLAVLPGYSNCWAQTSKPNLILINLDDADDRLFSDANASSMFPNIVQLASEGVSFANFHVTTPLCGPSRACLYRGQYAHNTGCKINRPGTYSANGYEGGFRYYREQGFFEDDLSTWMKGAGYRTMMVGKFLHAGYQNYSPPGWDDFRHILGGRYFGAFVFSNETRPEGRAFQLSDEVYRTTYELEESIKLISQQVEQRPNQPFFLNINTLGPHRAQASRPQMVEPRMVNWWQRISQPRSAAYDEIDISDKSSFLADLPRLGVAQNLFNEVHYRERALATRSVDDLVGAVRDHLTTLGIADNTYVFVTSDNGYHQGQQRSNGKGIPFERVTRVPCFVVGPNVPQGQISNHLIAHIDFAPTLVSLGGSRAPAYIDGRSFERLLQPDGILNTPQHRLAMLIENWANVSVYGRRVKSSSMSVRFRNEIYTEWSDGGREYYDFSTDPDQLENRFDQLSGNDRAVMASWLRVLYQSDRKAETRFLVPLNNGDEVKIGGALEGMAEHWMGVDEVRLVIWDRIENQYWNGMDWQDDSIQLSANVLNRGGQLTQWFFDQTPDADSPGSEDFVVFAWAYDANGEFAPPRNARWILDRTPPVLGIDSAVPTEFGQPVELFGTANDAVGTEKVCATVRDANTLQYWNGTDFQTDYSEIEIPVTSGGTWRWNDTLPLGRYQFRCVARDGSGNESNTLVFSFRVR